MPNVEIHGLSPRDAEAIRKQIWTIFADAPYVSEMVVTVYLTVVTDSKGTPQSFLRLMNSEDDPGNPVEEDVLRRLGLLSMDLEHGRLIRFIPASRPCPYCHETIKGGIEEVNRHIRLGHSSVDDERSGL